MSTSNSNLPAIRVVGSTNVSFGKITTNYSNIISIDESDGVNIGEVHQNIDPDNNISKEEDFIKICVQAMTNFLNYFDRNRQVVNDNFSLNNQSGYQKAIEDYLVNNLKREYGWQVFESSVVGVGKTDLVITANGLSYVCELKYNMMPSQSYQLDYYKQLSNAVGGCWIIVIDNKKMEIDALKFRQEQESKGIKTFIIRNYDFKPSKLRTS